ncbi:hypothetical protein SEVIR_8G253700v4 [Setaria viridis]|uniref:NB-ARC domain-containing protein n=1 Tax=Setaria viridis TaxID=4556 RepID=A0A4U6TXW7_SETVI|nr:disease resistance protein Pik-2-like [Setaria viridis]TKW02647.1 hypothetical protein SEVIR_8G253700v2 [Setaria viridis]
MEATALSLAKLTLDTLLPVAKNALADEAVLLLGVHEEVSFITNELEMMQAFLRAAGADHRASNEVAKIWVKQVRDLAYDVEDCLQEYLALDLGSVGCDMPPCARWLRACAVPSPGRLRTQHQIAVRIKQVKGRVEEISKRNLRYSIVVQPAGPAAVHDITIEHQVLDAEKFAAGIATEESDLVGRDQHRAELVDRLVSLPSSEPLQVFALWGSGGVGKTVLARDVLRSPKLRQAFQLRPWVTVPHPFIMAEFISSLASQLEIMEESRSLVFTKVVRHLRDRKYAMVVDDVLTIAEWEKMKQAFPDSSTGSCIVVTTRDEVVAKHCSTSSRHVRKLDCLSHTESFQLLCKKVQLQEAGPLMPMVDAILKRCCGLPLAVAAVGKLLATMKTPAEWKKLHDHLGSELKGNPRLEEITNVLTSSYEGLPYHLKSCFLYLSIFPKYRELRQTRVSWRWMAEGLVPESSSGGMDPEDNGENYFNQLISRSMIQPATTWVNLNDRINTAQVHDMMREIILAKATEENQLFVLNARLPSRLPREKIRHLVLTSDCRWPAGSDVLEGISNMWQVRSLTVNGECPPRLIIPSKMKMLRVLDLEDSINATDEHLSGIGELRQLKYLGLKKTAITKLPESVGRLKFLQSLDLRGTKVTTIPQGVTKLERLRHLMAGNGMLYDDDNTISSLPSRPSCFSWRAISSINARKLASTTTFWPQVVGSTAVTIGQHSGVRLPDGFGRLKSMHNLGTVDVGKDGHRIFKEISKLAGLWSLEITELTNRDGLEFCHMIDELVSLRDLEVRSRAGRSGLLHCLSMIESPPLHLITLRLCGHLGRLPSWIGHLQYVTKIKLLATELEQDAIEMLGDLPNLTGLHLWRMSYIGQELRLGTGKFAKLKLIDINRLEDLVSLVIEGASTPQLEWLWLKQCCRLSDDENGVVGVPLLHRLRELQIMFCGDKPKLVDLLQKQLGDHQNRPLFECF